MGAPPPVGPALDGFPTLADARRTAAWLASCQEPDGALGWERRRHVDAWNHTESAMALLAFGEDDAADAAYAWLRASQRPDGTWPMKSTRGVVQDASADSNQVAYVAVGTWHHWLVRGERSFVETMWPHVRRALDWVVARQLDWGGIAWNEAADGRLWDAALLAGSSSIVHSLDCGVLLGSLLGEDVSHWAGARERLALAVREHEALFLDNSRYSMDWYYPVLGGVLRGDAARERLEKRWDEFVRPGRGIHCVADHNWVTGAETCELALALDALGDREGAREQVRSIQHLRDTDGAYWTGFVHDEGVRWPIERSTWTAAAVLLAVDAVTEHSGGSGIFRLA
jgi:hypothetical protein